MECKRGERSCSFKRWLRELARLSCLFLVVHCPRLTSALDFNNSTNTFVERCQLECSLQKDLTACGKYRVVRWFHDVVREKEFSYGPFRVIRIPAMQHQAVLPKLPRSRVFKSGAVETLNFVRDAVEDLLTKRAIVYTIDNAVSARSFGSAPMIMEEDELTELQNRKESEGDWRIFKKKKSLILPILILLNLIKLKLLLLPIFLGVHFIKKLLVLGSLAAPSILAHLKVCKVQQPHQTYPHHIWSTAAEAPVDYPTGYGQDDSSWAHRNDFLGHVPYPAYPGYRNPYG